MEIQNFWDNFYNKNHTNLSHNSNFSSYIYKKYLARHLSQGVCLNIADIGCGNMRDTNFFLKKGCRVTAVDPSLNKKLTSKEGVAFKGGVKEAFQLHSNKFSYLLDIVYMRWFMHAMPYSDGKDAFRRSVNSLKQGGLICAEVRSVNDENLKFISKELKDGSFITDHSRWLYSEEQLRDLATLSGLEILEIEEGKGFSKTATDDPLLIRMVAQKPFNMDPSANFGRYKKHETGLLRLERQYEGLDMLHSFCEEFGIKYSAVAGSALGLVRHGGIIPWDNDIDIGLTPHHWNKLFKLAGKLKKMGYRVHRNTDIQYHIGPIDVFKLKSNPNFYCGAAGTKVHKDEWKTLKKQIFGGQYIYAPTDCSKSLTRRYGKNYYNIANLRDGFHNRHEKVKNFKLAAGDRRYNRANYINNY